MTTETAEATPESKAQESINRVQTEINELILQRDKVQAQYDSLKAYDIPDDNPAVIAFVAELGEVSGKIERAQSRKASFERGLMTGKFIEPLIMGFGTFDVKDGVDAGRLATNFNVAAFDAFEAEINEQANLLAEKIKIAKKFRTVFAKANVPAEIVTEFRPLRFVQVEGQNAIKLDVASTVRTGGTGTRGARQIERLTKAPKPEYVGKIIGGEDGAFKNWTALAQHAHENGVISDEQWLSLTKTSEGKDRSVSFRQVLQNRFGFESEIVGGSASVTDATESDDSSEGSDDDSEEENAAG